MGWFDREQVATALKAGRISADDASISHLDNWLYILDQIYRLPSWRRRPPPPGWRVITSYDLTGPSKHLKDLHEALQGWFSSDFTNKIMEEDLLSSFNPSNAPFLYSLSSIFMSVSKTIDWLESAVTNSRPRQKQTMETSFFIDLYTKYTELSDKKGLSDGGPAIRFIVECASILNMEVPQGLRRRIQQAIVARKKKPPPASPPDLSGLFDTIAFFAEGKVKPPR